MNKELNIEPEFMKRPKENPFRTPDHYFDSIEDRVMGTIKNESKRKTTSGSGKIFQLLKPVLGIAASFAIIYLLAYYPTKYITTKSIVNSVIIDTTSNDDLDAYTLNFSMIDESSLVKELFRDTIATQPQINQDELLAYLSTEMTDREIYNEMQK